MTNISGWVTFKEVIDSIQLAGGDSSDQGQFMRKLNFAIKGYEELRLRHLPATKTIKLPIEGEMRIVSLRSKYINDFLKFVSIGNVSGGKFREFKPKSGMISIVTTDCGVDSRGSNTGGYYCLDLENYRIIVECEGDEAILNYTPTGVRMDGITYIPRMCRMVIETYVEYQCVLRDKGYNMGDRITFEKEYIKALNLFRGLQYDTDELFNEYYELIATGRQY